jgi:hypothetical protein
MSALPRLGRRRAVVVGLVLGAATLAAITMTWVRATTSSALEAEVEVAVAGSDAAASASAGALVVLASSLAMALGGRWGARVAATGVALGGALVVVSAAVVLRDPGTPAAAGAQAAVGVGALAGEPTVTAAVWLALLTGAVAVALGLLALAAAGEWSRGGRRHERPVGGPAAEAAPGGDGSASVADDQDAWDALSRGEDPT